MKRVSWMGVFSLSAAAVLVAGCDGMKAKEETPTVSGTGTPVVPPATKAAAVKEIVVDNNDPGFKSVGTWTPAEGGKDKSGNTMWAVGDSPELATATFTPEIKEAGMYEVYEWHGQDPNGDHATNEQVTIKHAEGSKTVKVDLKKNEGQWNSLGVYKFAAGKGGSVTVSNKEADGNVLADAVRFVKK